MRRLGLSVAVRGGNDCIVIEVCGEVDGHSTRQLEARLNDVIDGQGNLDVMLDLERMTFIGSPGLTVIGDALTRICQRGGTLSISAPNAAASRLLGLVGLDAIVATPPPATTPLNIEPNRP